VQICELNSPQFGTVAIVAVGATMVGSINFLRHAKDQVRCGTAQMIFVSCVCSCLSALCNRNPPQVKKGDQHGYFAFGGSTVMVFFEPGSLHVWLSRVALIYLSDSFDGLHLYRYRSHAV